MPTRKLAPFLIVIFLSGCDIWEESLSDPEEIFDKAVELYKEKSFKQAQQLFEKAIPMFEQQQASNRILEGYSYLAQTNLGQGDIRLSIGNLEAAIGWSKKLGDFQAETRMNTLMGDVYSTIREYSDAIKYYRSALLLVSAVNDEHARAEAQLKLATALSESGETEESLDGFRNAIALCRLQKDKLNLAMGLRELAKLYKRLGQFAEAANSLRQALETISESEEPLLAAKLRMDLGVIHRGQGDMNAALADFRDATNILRIRRVGKEYEGLMLFHIGAIYFDTGRYTDAKRFFESALKIAQSEGDRISENYLYVFIIQCNLGSMPPEQKAAAIGKLQQSYEQIARRLREAAHRTGEAYLWMQIGRMFEGQGNLKKAEEMYRTAITLDESSLGEYIDKEMHEPYLEELHIGARHEDWYFRFAALLVKLGKEGEALSYLEAAQEKSLVDVLGGVDITIRNSQLQKQISDTRRAIRQLKILELELSGMLGSRRRSADVQKVNRLRGEMVNLRQGVTENANRIALLYPNYEPLIRPGTLKISELAGLIPRGTLVLNFLPTEDRLYIFAMTSQRLEMRESPVRKDTLTVLMQEYRQLMQDPNVYAGIGGTESIRPMTRFAQLSTRLYDLLIRPIDELIDRNLIIVQNKSIEGFPFHCIERQDRSGNVKYLIELTTVDYLPSLSSLRFRTASPARIREVVVVGNPSGKNWSVDYELRDVRSFVKGTTVLLGAEASWANIQSQQGDILQISTEFAYGRGSSPLGEMMFSSGAMLEQTENVPFEKLTELNSFPVIILSNQYGQGVGLSSLHAFLLRLVGTSDVFLNCWFADRKASKFFSEFFYTHLANGLAPGDAYRQALLNLIRIREVSHPRSWGQYFHFGVG